MVSIYNEAFRSREETERFGIEVNPKERKVVIRLRLSGEGEYFIGGDLTASHNWGEGFYKDVAKDVENIGYKVKEEKVSEDDWEIYELVVEAQGRPVARYGQLEKPKSEEDFLDISFDTHMIPYSGHITFYIEDENSFPQFLNELIQVPNGVIGQRYREFLRRMGENPEEVMNTITKL